MAPDLEQLHEELAGKVLVRFNELRREQQLAEQYRIRVMPTQVYVDGKGNEVFRHEGYASKADMLAKMKELGFL
jgi:thioredoxin 1